MLTSDSRGREVILAVLQSGDYVGEMSLIDNEPHSATVRAEVQTDMLILGRTEFSRCLPEGSSLAYAILRGLVSRLRSADRQIESLALLDVYGRVIHTLEGQQGPASTQAPAARADRPKVSSSRLLPLPVVPQTTRTSNSGGFSRALATWAR